MVDRDALVIIVNYYAGKRLLRCLDALAVQHRPTRVLVIDNGSLPGELRQAFELFPQFDYFPLRRNVGFAEGVNIAVQRTSAKSIILLNPDTEPQPEFTEEILQPLSQAGIAAVAGRLVFESNPDVIASAGITIFRNALSIDAYLGDQQSAHLQPEPVFGASGGAAAYARDAFLEAGGLPEPFFLYQEDVDLAWRLRLLGYNAITAPRAIVHHAYSASTVEGSPLKRRLNARNRLWCIVRCIPNELLRDMAPTIAWYEARALAYGIFGDWSSLLGRIEGGARMIPRLIERRQIQRSMRIDPRELEQWLNPPLSVRQQLQLRKLTKELSSA